MLQLHGDPAHTPPRPGVKLKVSTAPYLKSGKVSKCVLQLLMSPYLPSSPPPPLHSLPPLLSSSQKSRGTPTHTLTNVEAFLSGLHLNFDLTLIDRLQLLVYGSSQESSSKASPPSLQPFPSLGKVKHSLYMTSSNVQTIHQVRLSTCVGHACDVCNVCMICA